MRRPRPCSVSLPPPRPGTPAAGQLCSRRRGHGRDVDRPRAGPAAPCCRGPVRLGVLARMGCGGAGGTGQSRSAATASGLVARGALGRRTLHAGAGFGSHNAWAPSRRGADHVRHAPHGRRTPGSRSRGRPPRTRRTRRWRFSANTAGRIRCTTQRPGRGVETDGRVKRRADNPWPVDDRAQREPRRPGNLDHRPHGEHRSARHRGRDRDSPPDVWSSDRTAGRTGEGNLSARCVRMPRGEWVEFDVTESGGILHACHVATGGRCGRGRVGVLADAADCGGPAPRPVRGDRGLTEADGMLVPELLGGDLPEAA